jgi:uridine kinase
MLSKIKIIAIAGGSGSGKTTFAKRLLEKLGKDRAVILGQDNYYLDQSHKFDKDGGAVNFDHPDSLEFSLMATHLQQLRQNQTVEIPLYDFATHSRKIETIRLAPHPIILVDGILILSQKILLPEFDYKIFIDCDEETRFNRRLNRDVKERGRTPEGVKEQFYAQVKPMHDEFVEPSKNEADLIVSKVNFDRELELLFSNLKT